MITAENLTKVFGGKVAVDNLTFEVEGGEILGFLGPNAAGKTTTMRMLTGFFPPTSGKATIAGFDVETDSINVRRNIGYLPEMVPLYPEMTVREFVEFAAAAKGVHHADRDKAVSSAIGRCNLASVQDQLIDTISRGYRQRVGIAQAIINNPKVLILDEPTVGLDPAQIRDIRQLIRELGESSTVILSTHILPEVSATCSRVIILAEGAIRAMDTPEKLTARLEGAAHLRVRVVGPQQEVTGALQEITGVNKVKRLEASLYQLETEPEVDVGPLVARAVVGKQWDLLELTPQTMSLEDIFLEIVRDEGHHQESEAQTQEGD